MGYKAIDYVVDVAHVFCGIGGGSLGFKLGNEEYVSDRLKTVFKGSYRNVLGIDCDPGAIQNYERITGSKGKVMDLFSRQQYIAFFGKEPEPDWHEVQPADIRALFDKAPEVLFLSPPCKGFSGLLPRSAAESAKYQALNELTVRGIFLFVEAFKDDLPGIILMENVPGIKTRGARFLREIDTILKGYGYESFSKSYDCGEMGGLSQHRRRFLLASRNTKKIPNFVYEPVMHEVQPISAVLSMLPAPDDVKRGGKMHRLPNLSVKTWIRLALIRAGGDWRDLQGEYELNHTPRKGSFFIVPYDKPAPTITTAAGVGVSNSPTAVQDFRIPDLSHFAGDASAPLKRSDYVLSERKGRYPGTYRIVRSSEPCPTILAQTDIQCGALCVADPMSEEGYMLGCSPRSGVMGVVPWNKPAPTIIASMDVHAGTAAVQDVRLPGDNVRCKIVIIAEDGTWHRPLTTYECAMIQGFPSHFDDGEPFELCGNSDKAWREWIGNAVPSMSARGIARTFLRSILASVAEDFILGFTPIWVQPTGCEELVVYQ